MKQVKIETQRLVLRPWKRKDIENIVDGLNDFETAKNITSPFPYTKGDAESFLVKTKKEKDGIYLAIALKENDEAIGGTVIKNINGKIKGGIWINRKYTHKGYGTEAFKARAKYIFENFNFDKIENGFFDFNEVSWKMQQRLGYKIVSEKKNFSPALNKEVVEIVTELRREDLND